MTKEEAAVIKRARVAATVFFSEVYDGREVIDVMGDLNDAVRALDAAPKERREVVVSATTTVTETDVDTALWNPNTNPERCVRGGSLGMTLTCLLGINKSSDTRLRIEVIDDPCDHGCGGQWVDETRTCIDCGAPLDED